MKYILLFILLTFLLVGCTQIQTNTQHSDINNSLIVLNEYLEYQSYSSSEELSFNLKNQIPLTNGLFKNYLQKRKDNMDYLILERDDFKGGCLKVSSEEICNEFEISIDETLTRTKNEEIKSITFVNKTNGLIRWEVIRHTEYSGDVSFKTVYYILIKEKSEWKLYDFINDQSESLIKTSDNKIQELNEAKISFDEFMQSNLDNAKLMGKDKCIDLSFGSQLTVSELENEKDICYTGKYTNFAVQQKDYEVCDDIFEPSWKGTCYGSVAASLGDISICDNMSSQEYDAKGYSKLLSDKDVCYYYLIYSDKLSLKDKDESCHKITNTQLQSDCLNFLIS